MAPPLKKHFSLSLCFIKKVVTDPLGGERFFLFCVLAKQLQGLNASLTTKLSHAESQTVSTLVYKHTLPVATGKSFRVLFPRIPALLTVSTASLAAAYAKMSHSPRESTGVSSVHGKYDRNVIPLEVSHHSLQTAVDINQLNMTRINRRFQHVNIIANKVQISYQPQQYRNLHVTKQE